MPLASCDELWCVYASMACEALGLERIWFSPLEVRWRAWYTPEPIIVFKVSSSNTYDTVKTRSKIQYFGDDFDIEVYPHHKRDLDFAILNRKAYTRLLSITIGYLEVSMKVHRERKHYFEEEKYD